VVRCATLAGELIGRGWRATLAARELPPALGSSLAGQGIEVLTLPELDSEAEAAYLGDELGHVDVVVTDNYGVGATWQRRAAIWATLVVAIDDLADRPQAVQVLLNQNLGVDDARYIGLVDPDATLLTGPTYALLRPAFAAAREHLRRRTGSVKRILVFMSGADQDNVTLTAARAAATTGVAVDVVVGSAYAFLPSLRDLAASAHNVSLHVNTPHMAALMESADLAIGAASSASWERCTLGLPVVLVTLADNQVDGARSLAEAGAAVDLGWFERVSEDAVVAAVRALMASPGKVLEMSRAAAGIADGLGTGRVADAIERSLESRTGPAPRAHGETR
jgi:UDP-2,4-diacetamido-2,4,6-trideoxy-beta-L-altropyranose hydrolase